MKPLRALTLVVTIPLLGLTACSDHVDEPPGTLEGAQSSEPMETTLSFVTWYQYDQNNQNPDSDERVGNEYLRASIPQFNKAFEGQWNWVNVPKAFDKLPREIVAAVRSGGEVPDLVEIVSTSVVDFSVNRTMQDLRPWAEKQSWWPAMDENAVASCSAPDGALICIPIAQRPHLVYVWKDRFPEGYPDTIDEFLVEAERLKVQGYYIVTFFGSTDFDGEGLSRAIWTTISSFGGGLDDGNGNLDLDTPENIAAIEFLRLIVQEDYVPEIAFTGGFTEEEPFKDASAASFPTGLFGYRYLNPLFAPNGNEYVKGNEQDMLDALEAGDIYLSNFISAEAVIPGCGLETVGIGIPVGAANPEAAYDYVNWVFEPRQNAEWVLSIGAGIPALATTAQDSLFESAFYAQANDVIAASACKPWQGSLTRPDEAAKLIMNVVYELIKKDPTADIQASLARVEEQYNAGN